MLVINMYSTTSWIWNLILYPQIGNCAWTWTSMILMYPDPHSALKVIKSCNLVIKAYYLLDFKMRSCILKLATVFWTWSIDTCILTPSLRFEICDEINISLIVIQTMLEIDTALIPLKNEEEYWLLPRNQRRISVPVESPTSPSWCMWMDDDNWYVSWWQRIL